MINIYTHLRDETTPAPVQAYIDGVRKARRDAEKNGHHLMIHTRWRTVLTTFFPYSQTMLPRYDPFVPPTDVEFYTLSVYDGSGYRVRIELFSGDGCFLNKEEMYANS